MVTAPRGTGHLSTVQCLEMFSFLKLCKLDIYYIVATCSHSTVPQGRSRANISSHWEVRAPQMGLNTWIEKEEMKAGSPEPRACSVAKGSRASCSVSGPCLAPTKT